MHQSLQRSDTLEPVINFPVGVAGSQFCPDREARSDAYRVSASDERQRDGENWPQPFDFHPIAQRPCDRGPGLRRKSRHTLLSSSPWNGQSLRPPPRLARFSLATTSAGKLIKGSRLSALTFRAGWIGSPSYSVDQFVLTWRVEKITLGRLHYG